MTRTLTGVEAFFSATHEPIEGGQPHGHTWRVRVWWVFTGEDVELLKAVLDLELKKYDHQLLPQHLSRGEDMAKQIGSALSAWACDVWREAEGFYARWER